MAISRICNICLNQDHVQNICTNEKKSLLNTLVSLTKNTELSTRKNVYVCRKCNHDIENYKRLRQLCHKNLFELPQLYFQLKTDISDDNIDTEVIVTDFLKQRLPKSSASGLLHLNIGTEDECVLINNESSNVNVIKIINFFESDEGLNTENVEDDIESNVDNFTNNSEASTSQNTFNLPMRRHGFIEKKPSSTFSKCPHEPSLLLYKCYVCGQRFNMRRNLRIHHEEHEQIDFKLHDIRRPNNLMEGIPTAYSSSSLENTNSVSPAEKETTSGEDHDNQNILNDENTQNITCERHNMKLQTMNCIYQESSGGGSESELYQNENNLNMEVSENNGYINGISKKKEVRKNICESNLQEFNVCSTECSIGENQNLTAIKINEFESHETRSRILRSSVNSELENEQQENENVTNKLPRCKRRSRSTVESSVLKIYDELDEEVQKHRTSHRCKSRLRSTVDGNQLNDSQEQITKKLQNNPNNKKRILRSQSTVDRTDQYNLDEESRKESQYKNITKRLLRSSVSQHFDGEFENKHNLNENIQNDEVRKKVVSEKYRISLFKQLNEGFDNELLQNKIIQEDRATKKRISGRKTPCLPLMVDLNHINNPSEEIQNEFNHNESTSNGNVRKKVTNEKRIQNLRFTADCRQLSNSSEEIQNEFTQNRNISNIEIRKEVTDWKRTPAILGTVDRNHLNYDEDFENELPQNVNFQQKKVRAGRRTPCLRSIDFKQISDFDGELLQSENIRANNEVRKKVIDGRRTPRLQFMVDHNDSDEESKNEFQQNDNISPNNETNENIPANNKVRKKTKKGRRTTRRSKRVRSCGNYLEIEDFRKLNLKNSPKGKLLFRKKSGCKNLEIAGAGSSISEKTKRFSEKGTTFQCSHCPKLCKSIYHVLYHERKHLKTDNEQNTFCKITKRKGFRKNLSLNYRPIATKEGIRLQCVHCPKVCASQNTLSSHQIIHTPEYAILKADLKPNRHLKTCHVCGKQVRAMHLHLRVHRSLDNPEKNPPQQSQALSTDVKKNVTKRGKAPYSHSNIDRTHPLKSCDICGKEVRMMHLHKRIHKKKEGVIESIQSSVLNGQQIKQASEKSNYCESDINLKTSETKNDAEAAATKINNED